MAVDISPNKDGGVLKEIIKEGTGEETPGPNSKVKVHYTGTFLDGKKFDSSKDRNEPFQFDLEVGQVIKGWDIGVSTMKKGEVAVLTCAPEYAYGKTGSPPNIPGDSTLKFEVELIDWEGQDISPDKDASIELQTLKKGEGFDHPGGGSLVDMHITGSYDGKVFEDRDVKFVLSEGEGEGIVEGIEIAAEKFLKNGKYKIKIKSKHAFGNEGNEKFNIPPNATVEYICELKSFEPAVESWNLDAKQKIEHSKIFKEKGTAYFKDSKYKAAIKMYKKIVEFLSNEYDYKDELKDEKNGLLVTAQCNLALCYLKTDQNYEAKEACTEVLTIDPNNEKALFRRGIAYLGLASPEIAIKDFQAVVKIEPKNTAAIKQIAICNSLIKKELAKEKKLYANMFEKFAKEDKQKEEAELLKQPNVMHGKLGEWGQEERPGGRDATAFEKENPNILMLNANGTGEFKNM